MQGQKDINPSQLQSSFIVFLGVFWCIYLLSNTVLNVDSRSYESSFITLLAGLTFLDFEEPLIQVFLRFLEPSLHSILTFSYMCVNPIRTLTLFAYANYY